MQAQEQSRVEASIQKFGRLTGGDYFNGSESPGLKALALEYGFRMVSGFHPQPPSLTRQYLRRLRKHPEPDSWTLGNTGVRRALLTEIGGDEAVLHQFCQDRTELAALADRAIRRLDSRIEPGRGGGRHRGQPFRHEWVELGLDVYTAMTGRPPGASVGVAKDGSATVGPAGRWLMAWLRMAFQAFHELTANGADFRPPAWSRNPRSIRYLIETYRRTRRG